MKKILFLMAMALISLSVSAQTVQNTQKAQNAQTEHNRFISLNFGCGIPTGEFGSSKHNGAFADPGYTLDIDLQSTIGKHFSYIEMLSYNEFPMNKSFEDYTKEIFTQTNINGTGVNSSISNLTIGNWQSTNLMIGPGFSLKEEKYIFSAYGLAGCSFSYSPEVSFWLNFNNNYNSTSISVKRQQSYNESFCYGGNLNFKYFYSKRIYLQLGGTFIHTKATFAIKYKTSPEIEMKSSHFNQKINTINATIGIGYAFMTGKK
jgi:hypothetical protein